jgi:hypothetical protein
LQYKFMYFLSYIFQYAFKMFTYFQMSDDFHESVTKVDIGTIASF